MNYCAHSGYIGQDLVLKKTKNEGKSVLNFTIGVRKTGDKTIWVNYTAYEKTAEFIASNFKRGSFIIVQSSYEPDVVEKDGKTIVYSKFKVDKVDFGNKVKEDSEPRYNPPYDPTPPNEPEFDIGEPVGINPDDLPF